MSLSPKDAYEMLNTAEIENGKLRADNERLRAIILDGCVVFEHYDLPEHAFHYRRALEAKP